ncbi:MAG: hypothetical protein WCZ88_17855 [Pigmentiphaga sp.]
MGKIVYAAGVPHAPGLVGLFDTASSEVQTVVRDTFRTLTAGLVQAKPDVLVVFANDHLANSRIRAYPDFLIGMSRRHTGPHEWFKPWIGCRDYDVAGAPEIAASLFKGMTQRGIRMHLDRENLKFDDNISVPVVLTGLDELGIPLIPIMQNCTVPPMPDQHACYRVGQALADWIQRDLPDDCRVALIGSGGLSHEPGGARYYFIDEDFDRWFLHLCTAGDHQRLLNELTLERMEQSGSGGTCELLAWVVIMGAIGPCRGDSPGYAVHTDFKCGIGGVIWQLESQLQSPEDMS